MLQMDKDIKERHFDLAISFDRKFRPALLCWLAGIPCRVGPSKVFDDKPSRVTWLYTDVVQIYHDLLHTLQAETYQTIVRKFTGITIGSRHMAQVVYATSLKLTFYSTPKRTSLFGGGIHIHNDYPLIFHNLTSLPDDTG
jgi:ADP-heptose:LPS heptosyltransferase